MDSECSAADMQTPGDDETGPSCTVSQAARRQRASESAEARERRLERQRARRRHLLASETAVYAVLCCLQVCSSEHTIRTVANYEMH